MLYGCPIAPASKNTRGISFAGLPFGCRPSMKSTVCAGPAGLLNAIAVFLDNLVPGCKKNAPASQTGRKPHSGRRPKERDAGDGISLGFRRGRLFTCHSPRKHGRFPYTFWHTTVPAAHRPHSCIEERLYVCFTCSSAP